MNEIRFAATVDDATEGSWYQILPAHGQHLDFTVSPEVNAEIVRNWEHYQPSGIPVTIEYDAMRGVVGWAHAIRVSADGALQARVEFHIPHPQLGISPRWLAAGIANKWVSPYTRKRVGAVLTEIAMVSQPVFRDDAAKVTFP